MTSSSAPTEDDWTDEDFDFLAADLTTYAEVCLVIRPKTGDPQPLIFNASQRFVHERLDKQKREKGYVRALCCKGRQQGVSTYVGARFYHKVTNRRGARAFILTHEQPATSNLFGMTKRFHDNCMPEMRPETGASNANELTFPVLDSGYKVATAGGNPVGRSETLQYLHGSEFAYWPNTDANLQGLLEAVPLAPDTEVILESTSAGPGDTFHAMWKAAKRGQSDYIAIFVPWFIHEEYVATPPDDWAPPKAFAEYADRLSLLRERTYWAWRKNRDMASARGLDPDVICQAFKREYPATDDEAFEEAGDDLARAIPLAWLRAAQARAVKNSHVKRPVTGVGIDVSGREGGKDADKTAIAACAEVRFTTPITMPGSITIDGPAIAGASVRYLADKPVVAVDLTGGWGGDVLTTLTKSMKQTAYGVNFAKASKMVARRGAFTMRNMRAALYWAFREALDPEYGDGLELDVDEETIEDLAAASFEVTPSGVLIEEKDQIRKRLKRSPDKGDAVLLAWWAARAKARLAAQEALRINEEDAGIGGGRGGSSSANAWMIG